jgi:glyoxylase-like metal-dependent hydrolase (beta-lactamase superfamily II)
MSEITENFSIVRVGMLDVNCYIVPMPEKRRLYVIDPGSEADAIVKKAKEFDYDEAYILMTHGHVDHISAAGETMKELGAKALYIHNDDIGLYKSPNNHLMPFVPAAKNLPEPTSTDAIDDENIEIIHTPGHTPGGVCYLFKNFPALFSGDTIFSSSIGRSDLPGGDGETLIKSIREKVLTLPEDLQIFPGHGPATTVRSEKISNPYL